MPVPFYGILSHTWGPSDEEVTLENIQDGGTVPHRKQPSYEKLHFTHCKAAEDGLLYFWIDTCCIKKSDSTELQRSLNSMFYWYQRAARCYVYLEDVSEHDFIDEQYAWKTAFSRSKWFKRGWTLQELIAPKSVMFYSQEGRLLGDKQSLAETLAVVTGISTTALLGADLSRFSKEARLSWANGRVTKVPEDAAYSLLGIFGVTLPMFYADGEYEVRKRAALEELDSTIERASLRAGKTKDLVRIGGASYDDLKVLDKAQLEQLDCELSAYAAWFFNKAMLSWKDTVASYDFFGFFFDWGSSAEFNMGSLLRDFGVGYDPPAPIRSPVQDDIAWENRAAITLTAHEIALLPSLESFWYEDGSTAARTLIDLKIWLGKWEA
ncbi:hypothetical protein N0V95_005434 [Ascochyta clinopodiicola]|nr:hypothetical protein N0V95_005434 [Ascochyta clinopodiicola]